MFKQPYLEKHVKWGGNLKERKNETNKNKRNRKIYKILMHAR